MTDNILKVVWFFTKLMEAGTIWCGFFNLFSQSKEDMKRYMKSATVLFAEAVFLNIIGVPELYAYLGLCFLWTLWLVVQKQAERKILMITAVAVVMVRLICEVAIESYFLCTTTITDFSVVYEKLPNAVFLYFMIIMGQIICFLSFRVWRSRREGKKAIVLAVLTVAAIREEFVLTLFVLQSFTSGFEGYVGKFYWQIFWTILELAVILLVVAYLNLQNQEEKYLADPERIFEYYTYLENNQNEVRRMYHDLKNHLMVLEGLHQSDETKKYIGELSQTIEGMSGYYNTGIPPLDILLHDKKKLAEEKKIRFDVKLEEHCIDFLKGSDACVIFSDAIDNAIEACDNMEGNRWISIKAGNIQSNCILFFRNSTGEKKTDEKKKQDPFYHGFGLYNIKRATEKYKGTCFYEQEADYFRLTVMFPVAKKVEKR
ncbi:MAG: GHKL domain-containing protein [Lachnospiraceae bacterium]|nr:GHKL domain-containing protein [Lachnospiraceae bacterium]